MIGNYFDVSCGGKRVVRHNNLHNIFRYFSEKRLPCSYIYVGLLGGEYRFFKPVLTAANFDPDLGRLFVTYEAAVGAGELSGKTVIGTGFAAGESADLIVNACELNIAKKEGEPILICGTLFLQNEGGNLCFLGGGDNRLVRMLLGAESFVSVGFRLTYGSDFRPLEGYTYTGENPSYLALPSFSDSEIIFSASIAAGATDLILLLDMQPVLRLKTPMSTEIKEKSAFATQNEQHVFKVEPTFLGVEEFEVLPTTVTNFLVTQIPKSLSFYAETDLRLPVGSQVRTDPSGRHFAFVCGGRCALFGLEGRRLFVTKWIKARDVILCADGTAFFLEGNAESGSDGVAGGGVIMYKDGVERRLNFATGEKNAAASQDGSYVFGTYFGGGTLSFNFVSGGGTVTTSTITTRNKIATNAKLFSTDNTVLFCSKEEDFFTFTPSGEVEARTSWLKSIVKSDWYSDDIDVIYDGGRLLIFNTRTGLLRYHYNFGQEMLTAPTQGRFFGEFNIRNIGESGGSGGGSGSGSGVSGTAEISRAGEAGGVLLTVGGQVISVAIIGSFLYLFLADGSVKVYVVGFDSIRISAGRILKDSVVTHWSRYVTPISGKLSIKIKRA